MLVTQWCHKLLSHSISILENGEKVDMISMVTWKSYWETVITEIHWGDGAVLWYIGSTNEKIKVKKNNWQCQQKKVFYSQSDFDTG